MALDKYWSGCDSGKILSDQGRDMSTQASTEMSRELQAKLEAEHRRIAQGQIADVTRRAVERAAQNLGNDKKSNVRI